MKFLPRLSLARVVMLVATVVVAYLLFAAVQDVLLSQRLNREEDRLHLEIADLERQEIELEAIQEYLRTDEYVEGVARDVLGLVRRGETLIVVSSTVLPTPTPQGQDESLRPWWEPLFGGQ